MKKQTFLIFLIPFLLNVEAIGQVDLHSDKDKSDLSALLNFNFTGSKNNWSNLTPGAFYGWNEKFPFGKKDNPKFNWHVAVGPYVSSQISIKDSSSYFPALMTQGNAGIVINEYFSIGGDKFKILVSPANFGLKVLSSFTDSSKTLIQHNYRFAFGLHFSKLAMITFQRTHGWHNLTSESENNFKSVFSKASTDVIYWNITLQTKLPNDKSTNPLYFLLSWKNFRNKEFFGNLPNSRIITFGIVKSLDFSSGSQAAPAAPTAAPAAHGK